MNNGTLALTGANYTPTNTTIGSTGVGVTLATGANAFTVTPPALTTGNTSALNITNLTRTSGATAVFSGTGLGSSVAGNAQQFVTNINGSAASVNNGILGGWATAGATAATADNWATLASAQTLNATTTQGSTTVTLASGDTSRMVIGQTVTGTNFAPGTTIATITGPTTFTTSLAPLATSASISTTFGNSGIVALNAQAYTNITAAGALGAPTTSIGNYSINTITAPATITLNGTSNTINSLQISPGAAGAPTLDLNAGTLVVTSGGILRASTNSGVSTIQNGTLTAGTGAAAAELFFNLNNTTNAMTVSAVIADNTVSGPVTLVKSGAPGVASLLTLGVNATGNTYTGGTVVDSGTLTLSNTNANGTSIVAVPAGNGTNGNGTPSGYSLVINNGATVTATAVGQIAQTASVLINGGGTLNMGAFTNTLSSITFNNTAGGTAATPTLAVGTLLHLTAANAITEPNNNFATTPTISGTALTLDNSAPVITVSGLSPNDLIISAPITSAGGNVSITGGGSVVLSGASTFSTGVTLDTNTNLIFGVATTGAVTNGPVGTGTLTLNNNSTILSDGTARTIANAISVVGDFTFGGTLAGNGVTLSGTTTLGAGAHKLTVTSPLNVSTISGQLTGGTNLTKDGAGTLVLSKNTNNYGGSTTVANGILQLGAAGVIPDASALIVNAGAEFDVKAFAETVGSLAGGNPTTGGLITNSGAAVTLTTGGDNTSTTFAGVITAATAANLALTKIGTGIQTLSGANTYAGKTIIQNGAISVASINSVTGGTASSNLGAPTTIANGTIDLGATTTTGTLIYTGTGETTDRVLNLAGTTGGGTIDQSGTGNLKFTSTLTATGAGIKTLTLQGSTAGTGEIAGVIVNNSGTNTTAVTKLGTDTWKLSGLNTYTGTTTVNRGTLQSGLNSTMVFVFVFVFSSRGGTRT